MKRMSDNHSTHRAAAEIDYTIRRARGEDGLALGRLAQLDSALYDGGPALLAESDGELLAAVPLREERSPIGEERSPIVDRASTGPLHRASTAATTFRGGRSLADPFRPTAEVVAVLQLRAAQLADVSGATESSRLAGLRRLLRAGRRRHRYHAPA
jgi:hypothetical protein